MTASPDIPPAVEGPVDIGDWWSTLRDTTAAARPETWEGDDALYELADLLEPLDPAATDADADLIAAVLLVFDETALGQPVRRLAWLRWVQRATTSLFGLSDPRTLAAHTALAGLCFRLGHYGEAATAWQPVITDHERYDRWEDADDLRLQQAVCRYALGQCTTAVTVVQQAWQRWKHHHSGNHMHGVSISTVCMEMLRLCRRVDDARAIWPDIADHLEPSPFRYGESLTEVVSASCRPSLSDRAHGPVCAYRHRRLPATPAASAVLDGGKALQPRPPLTQTPRIAARPPVALTTREKLL